MKLIKLASVVLATMFITSTLSVGVMAAEEVFTGGDVWNYGTNWLTNTTYSEYITDRCWHGAKAWGNGEVTARNGPGGWANARTAIGSSNGWSHWDE